MNNNKPLFSVLIAQYNNGKYLQEAIDSVKSQTYTNWEIILVDDASTDNSKNLYMMYENDDRIKIFYNEENKGCGYTKRRCTDLANGDILGFLDPDDALLSDALELMTIEHLKGENISLVYSKYIVCNENLNKKYISQYQRNIPEGRDYLHFAQGAISAFASFKKNRYDKTEKINPYLKRAIDQDLYFKMEEVGSLVFIDKPLYLYRIHENGISSNENRYKAFYWHIKVVEDACQRREIIEESEDIVGKMIQDNFVVPLENENKNLTRIVYYPSIKDVLRCFYRYMRMIIKRLFS